MACYAVSIRNLPHRLQTLWRSVDVVPILAVTDVGLGTAYVLEPRSRALGAALATAREVMPIWAWGAIILTIGVASVLAISHRRPPILSMSFGAGWYVVFAGGTVWSAVHDSTAGLGGCVLFTSAALLHLVAARQR